jgi:hypothetical protein
MRNNMRKTLLYFLMLFGPWLSAQEFCKTTKVLSDWFAKNPQLRSNFETGRTKLRQLDKLSPGNTNIKPVAAALFTVPVVFHILHTGGNECISDAQVQDAVSILTRDYNKLNADTANVVSAFKNLIGNPRIEFQLATRDPNGNCTNGIIRHWDANTYWDWDFSNYIYTWPNTRYLNIYVVKSLGGQAAGYTFLPGSGIPPNVDAIVVESNYVGSIGTSSSFTSRVLTHEAGHWFGLDHVWGWNNVGTICGDDGIMDTPITKGFTSCNLGNSAICNPPAVENLQNYMDYSYCENMFTIGQAQWMQNVIVDSTLGRDYLSDPANLFATGITNPGINCKPGLDIQALPGLNACTGKSLTLRSFTWNAIPTSYSWTAGSGAVITNPGASITTIVFNSVGQTSVSCVVSTPAGTATQSLVINVTPGISNVAASQNESFENNSIALPSNWTILNPNTPSEMWTKSSVDGMNGTKCMFVPGENMIAGSLEILESPSYDFMNNPGAIFTFKYAYARQHPTHNDIFKVQASKNCGASWTDIYVPGAAALCQNSGNIDPILFHPFATQWKTYNITNHPNFFPFKTEDNVRFRFYFEEDVDGTGYGNRFYLDDISFETPAGINELSRSYGLLLYPNPSHAAFILELTLSEPSHLNLKILNSLGEIAVENDIKQAEIGTQKITINDDLVLTPGIYILQVQVNGKSMSRKIVVN